MLIKSRNISTHSNRWYSFEVNAIPISSRHLSFNYINILSHSRQSLTISTRSQRENYTNLTSKTLSILRRSINRRHPLSKQRYRLISLHILNVLSKLSFNKLPHMSFNWSSFKNEQIVPTTSINNLLKITLNLSRVNLCQLL